MLLRLSLVIAIIAALAAGVLNFVVLKEKIETVEKHRAEEQAAKIVAQTDLAKTTKDLEKTTADLTLTKETLATTETQRDKAQAEVAALTRKAADLTDKLAKATEERDSARADLAAYKATGVTPQQILGFNKQIKDLQDAIEVALEEKTILDRNLTKLQYKYDLLTKEDVKPPELPANLRGSVVATDPKWNFVILDIGEEQGVREYGELLVNRNGKLVAKVKVRNVEKGRCEANIMTGWKLGEVLEGDQVFPAL